MDQRQEHDLRGYGYHGSGNQRYEDGDPSLEYSPPYSVKRRDIHKHELMIPPVAYSNHGNCTEGALPEGEVPNSQPGLPLNQIHYSFFAIGPDAFNNGYTYSGNISPQGIPSDYVSTVGTFQQESQHSSQERGASDLTQAEGRPFLSPAQRCPDNISPDRSDTNWRLLELPERMPASFNGTSNVPYPVWSSVCPNCGNHTHGDVDSPYWLDQSGVRSTTEWTLPKSGNYNLQPGEEDYFANRHYPIEEPGSINTAQNPVTVQTGDKSAKKGPTKKRKRKPADKPRKKRTLNDEEKAHAKAVRNSGGPCQSCKRKKTKVREPRLRNLGSTLF